MNRCSQPHPEGVRPRSAQPWLITARLRLDAPQDTDVEAVFRIHADERTYAHLPSARMRQRDQAVELVGIWREHWARHGFGYAAVRGLDDGDEGGDVLGFAGLKHQRVADRDVLNLYYRFAPQAWGRGYAVEAASALVDWARATCGPPVLARIATNNPASARVAERAGLHRSALQDELDPVPHHIWLSDTEAGDPRDHEVKQN